MRTPSKLLAATAAAATACALAAPTSASAWATGSKPGTEPSTRITLTISGCDGCTFGVWNTTAAGTAEHPLTTVRIRNGAATFRVPTALTKGLALDWADPRGRYEYPGAVPAVSMALPQFSAGSAVSAPQARRATRAYYCWAGTRAGSYTIGLRLTTFRTADHDGEHLVTGAAIWASPTLQGYGSVRRLEKGPSGEPPISGLGHQDAPYCGG